MTASPSTTPTTPQVSHPMNGDVASKGAEPLSTSERAMARRLGLGLAVAVAFGCDLVVGVIRGSGDSSEAGWPDQAVGLMVGLLPILAAAPFGWLLGPRLARAHLPGKVGVAVAMSVLTMLLGDVLYVVGATTLSSVAAGDPSEPINLPGLLAFAVIGAILVGPFVIVLATLPAAVIWVCAFRLMWRSMEVAPTGRTVATS